MLNKEKPVNHGNADVIETNTLEIKIPMFRYEAIFDFYSEEPSTIVIQDGKGGDEIVCEQILRLRRWNTNDKSYSWSIYSSDRETLDNLVVRKVTWDSNADVKNMKESIRDHKEEILKCWPFINMYNLRLNTILSEKVVEIINKLDIKIENGIVLSKNEFPNFEWRNIELRRIYDWGMVHSIWSTHKKNEEVESRMVELISFLDNLLGKDYVKIPSIRLNYSMLPELYKTLVVEKNKKI